MLLYYCFLCFGLRSSSISLKVLINLKTLRYQFGLPDPTEVPHIFYLNMKEDPSFETEIFKS
jgi:hypothetical protein